MGIVGATVVGAWGLLRDTSRVLLDREMDSGVVEEIRELRIIEKILERNARSRLSSRSRCGSQDQEERNSESKATYTDEESPSAHGFSADGH